jgi:hypothetical protein
VKSQFVSEKIRKALKLHKAERHLEQWEEAITDIFEWHRNIDLAICVRIKLCSSQTTATAPEKRLN